MALMAIAVMIVVVVAVDGGKEISWGVVATGVSRVRVATEVFRPGPAGLPPARPAVLAPPIAMAKPRCGS